MRKIEKKIYKAREGAGFGDTKAKEFAEYRDANNLKTPDEIYEDARDNESSPFYAALDWNNETAGDKYRISQIKNIINHISVKIIYVGGEFVEYERGFVYIKGDESREIKSIEEALNEPKDRNYLIREAWSNLEGWLARYKQYKKKEFKKIYRAADETRPKLEKEGLIAQTAI